MPWKINGIPLSVRNLGDAVLSIRSQVADELIVSKAGACDVPAIAKGTWCVLSSPTDQVVFQGEAMVTQGEASGQTEKNLLRILGPWSDLERLTWREGNNLRLNFPPDTGSTEPVDLGEAVTLVLNSAIALGARLVIGSVNLSGQIPATKFDNTTCAAILIALLRWSPGAAVYFDYDTGGLPAIHIKAASGLAALNLPIVGCRGLSVSPRTDFQVPGVRLIYRKKIASSYGESEGQQLDSAGSPDVAGGLTMAIDLNPARVQYNLQKNRVKVAAVNPDSGDWWRSLGVKSAGAPIGYSSTGDTELDYYVTGGELQNWMLSEINGEANSEPHGCTGPLSESPGALPSASDAFSEAAPGLHIENNQAFTLGKRKFMATFGDGRSWSIDLPVTNLSLSGSYYRETLTAWDAGEPLPTGLAASFLEGAGRLAYQGNFAIVGQECLPLDYRPGFALNIIGSAWNAIAAPIYSVSHDLGSGRSTLEFGPNQYLGFADLLDLYRANRPTSKATQAGLEPEEPPQPVSYTAAAASASEPPAPGAQVGTLAIVLSVPDELAKADCRWVAVGPKTYVGKGEQEIDAEVGDYTLSFLPVWKKDEGLAFASASAPSVTVEDDDIATASGSYDAVQRLQLRKTVSGKTAIFDLNAQDIIDMGVPPGSGLLKAGVLEEGGGKKRVALMGEPWTEES